MGKTVVTLTTIPERLNDKMYGEYGFPLCIKSLLNQTHPDYEIHFNVPHVNVLTGEYYTIPDYIEKEEKIKVFRTQDLGPATKLIPTVERLNDPEDIIIVVDDDLVYHEDMVKCQIENQKKWKECVVGYDGIRSRNQDGTFSSFFGDTRDYYFSGQKFHSLADILQHYKSVSYKRRYFEDDFFSFVKDNFSWSDDLLMAAYFSFKKRDRVVETHESIKNYESFDDWLINAGAITFPVISHTHHSSYEGCNIFRQTKVDDNSINLYRFIDSGYIK